MLLPTLSSRQINASKVGIKYVRFYRGVQHYRRTLLIKASCQEV
nr:MAG TPA: hypothetical protein [Caudoviricetes sp.]